MECILRASDLIVERHFTHGVNSFMSKLSLHPYILILSTYQLQAAGSCQQILLKKNRLTLPCRLIVQPFSCLSTRALTRDCVFFLGSCSKMLMLNCDPAPPSITHEPFPINSRLGGAMASIIDGVYRQIISHYGLRLFKSDESPPPPPWPP